MSDPDLTTPQNTQPAATNTTSATIIWLVLCVASVFTWWLAEHDSPMSLPVEQISIIAIAIFKMYLVTACFMGIFKAPLSWHAYTFSTLILLGGILITLVLL